MCLPAALNAKIASPEQLQALQALTSHEYDQHVFEFCSAKVAPFLRAALKSPIGQVRACAVPVTCECTTRGARIDSSACHTPCAEIACDEHNCPTLLHHNKKLGVESCFCSRARACSTVMPPEDEPSMCRDWLHPKGDAGVPDAPSPE